MNTLTHALARGTLLLVALCLVGGCGSNTALGNVDASGTTSVAGTMGSSTGSAGASSMGAAGAASTGAAGTISSGAAGTAPGITGAAGTTATSGAAGSVADSGTLGTPPTLNAPFSHASAIATDGSDVYWTTGDGVIHRRSVSGGSEVTVASDPCRASDAIAVDDGYVYWTHGYTSSSCPGSVLRTPKQGGSMTTLTTGFVFPGGGGIVLDGQNVYFIGGLFGSGPGSTSVYALPKSGGAAKAIAGSAGATGDPAADGQNVYWITSSGDAISGGWSTSIMRASAAGGSSGSIATIPRNITALFFYGDRLYWAASGFHGVEYFCVDCNAAAQIQSIGRGDSAPTTEVMLASGQFIRDAAIDESGLWLAIEGTRSGQGVDYPPNDDHTGLLLDVPKGGVPSSVLQGLPFAVDLAIDPSHVFALGDSGPIAAAK